MMSLKYTFDWQDGRTFGMIPELVPSSVISTINRLEAKFLLRIRLEEFLVKSRKIFMSAWTYSCGFNCFVILGIRTWDRETNFGACMSKYGRYYGLVLPETYDSYLY